MSVVPAPTGRPVAFQGARVVDPASGRDGPATLLVRGGEIAAVLAPGDPVPSEAERRDCRGLAILPGLVDARVFTGQPGGEHRESLETLGRAALAGGVTTLLVMPDALPVIDEASLVSFVRQTADATGTARMRPLGALTKGLGGLELAEMGLMLEAGAAALGQGREPVADAGVLRRALLYARDFGAVVDLPPRERALSGGVMNASAWSSWLGLPGVPPEAETVAVLRDCELARATGTPVNLACLSSRLSLPHLARAKSCTVAGSLRSRGHCPHSPTTGRTAV